MGIINRVYFRGTILMKKLLSTLFLACAIMASHPAYGIKIQSKAEVLKSAESLKSNDPSLTTWQKFAAWFGFAALATGGTVIAVNQLTKKQTTAEPASPHTPLQAATGEIQPPQATALALIPAIQKTSFSLALKNMLSKEQGQKILNWLKLASLKGSDYIKSHKKQILIATGILASIAIIGSIVYYNLATPNASITEVNPLLAYDYAANEAAYGQAIELQTQANICVNNKNYQELIASNCIKPVSAILDYVKQTNNYNLRAIPNHSQELAAQLTNKLIDQAMGNYATFEAPSVFSRSYWNGQWTSTAIAAFKKSLEQAMEFAQKYGITTEKTVQASTMIAQLDAV